MTLTFLHTSDWQLGMTRHYLARRRGAEDDSQARFSSDRIDAVRRMGELARDRHCAFVLVAGDVFETQNVSRQVISRACSAMASIGLPVLLLPGNHDSLEPGCIWDRADFVQACPDNVTVLRDSAPIRIDCSASADGAGSSGSGGGAVEVIGVPLRSRHPSADPVAPVLDELAERSERGELDGDVTRILVAHGQLPGLSGQDAGDVVIDKAALDAAVADGMVSYVALGDRHIRWPEDPSSPIRYCGTQETTRFTDPGRGSVDLVEIDEGRVRATALPVGRWLHARVSRQMSTEEDVDALAAELASFDDPARTIIRYDLHGGLTVSQNARLESVLDSQADNFASLEPSEDRHDLVVLPDTEDLAGLDLPSWAASAAQELTEWASPAGSGPGLTSTGSAASGPTTSSPPPTASTAADALGLLRRLTDQISITGAGR